MSEEVKAPEVAETELAPEESLPSLLFALPGAPTHAQVEEWKTKYGEVYVSGFSESELFVWKPMTRPKWVELQIVASNPENQITGYKFEEMVCEACILWKSVKLSWADGKAGTPTSLHEQILNNSNFLTPQAAARLVVRL